MADGQHHEPMVDAPPPMPSERATGLVFAAAFAILAIVLRHLPLAAAPAALAGLACATLALFQPVLLAPLNKAWFRLGLLLNRIVSPVVMLILYVLVIVPAGLVMQRFRDPLLRRGRADRETYWIDRASGPPPTTMRDQF